MAVALETIRRITVQASTQGVDQATQSLNKFAAAQGNLATVTDLAARRQLSAEQAYKRQSLLLDENARMQDRAAKGIKVADDALRQGLITQTEHASRVDLINQKYQQGSTFSKAFAGSLSGVSGQLVALSAGAGPVGVFLSALGPWGLAAAVGIGALGAAFRFVEEESKRLGDKAVAVRQFADVTGLTAVQIGALRHAAADFNVPGDMVAASFEKLTANTTDLKRASGSLFDDLQRVSGELATQARLASTPADVINTLARAYKNAGDEAQKASIARAAFGRGGIGLGPVLGVIADAGGIANLKEANELTEKQTREWAALRVQIEETEKRAKNILASIFTEQGLQAALTAAQYMERAAKAAKELADQREGLSWWEKIAADIAKGYSVGGALPPKFDENVALSAARARLGRGQGEESLDVKSWNDLSDAFRGVQGPAQAVIKTLKQLQDDAAADAKLEKERISILGSAATIDEHRVSRLKDLKSALDDNKITQADYNRAVGAANLDATMQAEARRIALLGELAPVAEIVKQKQNEINKAILEGVRLSPQEIAAITERNKLLAENAKIENQIRFDRDQLFRSPRDQTIEATLRAAGIPPQSERANAIRDYMRMTDALKTIKDSGEDFAKTFVNGLLQGKSAIQSMIAGFDQLAQKMADKAIMDLFSGNFLQAAVEAMVAAAAALASMFLKSSEAQRKAAENLVKANLAASQLSSQLGGSNGMGSIATNALQMNLQVQSTLASFHGVVTQAGMQLFQDFQNFLVRVRNDFVGGWEGLLNQLGDNSAFSQARQNVGKFTSTLTDFVNNTRDFFGANSSQLARAQAAGQQALLSMLQGTPTLSEAATEMARIQGTATALQTALVQLGMSSTDAAAAINSGVRAALGNLTTTFTTGLTARLNSAGGKSFLNDFTTLFTQHAQDLADAAALGLSSDLANSVFRAEAQKIVNDTGLVGDAFKSLTDQFPELVGVVHEATGAVQDQIAAQKQLNDAAKNIVDYLNSLKVGPNSTLSPVAKEAAAQNAYNATYALAHAGNIDALNRITQDAENLRVAARELWGSSAPYQNLVNAITNELLALPAVQGTTDPVVAAVRDAITAIQQTTTAVGNGNTIADATRANTASQVSLQATQNQLIGTANTLTTTTNALLDAIRSLNDTSLQTLTLLNSQFAAHPISFSVTSVNRTGSSTETFNITNNMIDALNKIVYNTYAIAQNTFTLAEGTNIGTAGRPRLSGQFAAGGVIPAFGLGLVSEHLNPTFLRAGPEPITVSPYAPANDNSALVAEVRALRAEVAALRRENSAMIKNAADVAHADAAEMIDAQGDGTKKISEAVRMGKRDQRAA